MPADDASLVQRLLDDAFKGYAAIRLGKLRPEVVDELVRRLGGTDLATTEAKVGFLLEQKTRLQKLKRASGSPPEPSTPMATPPEAAPPEPSTPEPSPPEATPPEPSTQPVFKTAHKLRIVAFNCLKLRLDCKEIQREWDELIIELSRYDVLMLSEVRASDKFYQTRTSKLLEKLNACSEVQWEMRTSEPSGPGAEEVHLVLAKKPVSVLRVATLKTLDGLAMDHSPFVVLLEDLRFKGQLKRFNVVSVHFPPKSSSTRRAARDAQIRKFMTTYSTQAATRLDSPFTDQAAKELRTKAPYVAHVVGGDFNADAKELRELDAEKSGFEIVLGAVRTSVGGKSYDNFCINRDCKDHLTVGADVLDLSNYANFSAGLQGVSDHAPIALRLTEVPRAT